jgi:hypothetical protein
MRCGRDPGPHNAIDYRTLAAACRRAAEMSERSAPYLLELAEQCERQATQIDAQFGGDKDGEKQEAAEFHTVMVFGKSGEAAAQYHQGADHLRGRSPADPQLGTGSPDEVRKPIIRH